jgi:chromosome segregation ATPase
MSPSVEKSIILTGSPTEAAAVTEKGTKKSTTVTEYTFRLEEPKGDSLAKSGELVSSKEGSPASKPIAEATAEVKELESEKEHWKNKHSAAEAEISILKNALSELNQKYTSEIESLKSSQKSLSDTLQKLQASLDEKTEDSKKFEAKIGELNGKLAATEKDHQKYQEQRKDLMAKLKTKFSAFQKPEEATKKMLESAEGKLVSGIEKIKQKLNTHKALLGKRGTNQKELEQKLAELSAKHEAQVHDFEKEKAALREALSLAENEALGTTEKLKAVTHEYEAMREALREKQAREEQVLRDYTDERNRLHGEDEI